MNTILATAVHIHTLKSIKLSHLCPVASDRCLSDDSDLGSPAKYGFRVASHLIVQLQDKVFAIQAANKFHEVLARQVNSLIPYSVP